jgi:AAA+ superfamily predicted ATPase
MTRPYRDDREHLRDELARLDALLRQYLEEWWAETGGSVDEFGGLYVSDEEVARLLREPAPERGRPGPETDGDAAGGGRVAELAREIRARERATAADGTAPRLVALADRFDLERRHVDALLVALAPELDRKYETVYGYLRDDVTERRPTVDLALRTLYRSASDRLAGRSLFAGRSPLRRYRLVRLGDDRGRPLLSRHVTVDERVVAFLLGSDEVDEELAGVAEVATPRASLSSLAVGDDRRDRLAALVDTGGREPEPGPPMAYLHGPHGVGKRAAVEALCAAVGTPVLRADARAVVERDAGELLARLIREAHLQGAALSVEHLVPLPDGSSVGLDDVVRELDSFAGRVFLSGTDALPTRTQLRVSDHEFGSVRLPRPSYERRRALWEAVDSLPGDADAAELAATFRLTGGQIADAVETAERLANGDGLSAESIYRGCRAQSTGTLDALARRIEPGYTWADIVLPADELAHLREVAARVRHQGTVYSDWGFADRFSLGNGLTVLFSGPSGTGKTMAAEIVAGDAGLDLYRIDLASVVSKYVGETEKNLGTLFDEAEDSSAILLFDEADALFGKRSEVGDAHDRYANIEVDYLLQRVEEHGGTVVLTTNFEGNIDDAFRRRIHLGVEFPRPDRDSREAIWRKVFPEETPVDGLDVEFLSSLELTGGNVKNVALTAAFLAADDDASVGMEHVVRAARREFQKTGRLIDPEEFGEYRTLLT